MKSLASNAYHWTDENKNTHHLDWDTPIHRVNRLRKFVELAKIYDLDETLCAICSQETKPEWKKSGTWFYLCYAHAGDVASGIILSPPLWINKLYLETRRN